MAKTYAEKLKDHRWVEFANAYRRRISEEHYGGDSPCCHSCGVSGSLQVHHRRYYRGREPWEYEDVDLMLLCDPCHKRVHAVADEFYSWLISLEPHLAYEAKYLLDELVKCTSTGSALAHCKNAVRNLNYKLLERAALEEHGQ